MGRFRSMRSNVIITKTSEKEATILRQLVDEALVARRLKEAGTDVKQQSSSEGLAGMMETIQTVLLKLVRQGDTSLRMGDVTLALLQDTLAEARAGRKFAWDRAVPQMKDEGLSSSDPRSDSKRRLRKASALPMASPRRSRTTRTNWLDLF